MLENPGAPALLHRVILPKDNTKYKHSMSEYSILTGERILLLGHTA